MAVRHEKPWVVTLFAPPILRVTGVEYQRILREATLRQQLPPLYVLGIKQRARTPLVTRLTACRRNLDRLGWWPYERRRRFAWTDEDEIEVIWPKEPEAPHASQPPEEGRRNDACLEEERTT
jgi:hypothetical protein